MLRRGGKNAQKNCIKKVVMTIACGHPCRVKWAIRRITMNKVGGGVETPGEVWKLQLSY